MVCILCKTFHQDEYDLIAGYAQASGYIVVQPNDDNGLRACAATLRCFIPAGYDWRESAADNEPAITALIDRVIQDTGTDRVDILAHSQGGLLAQAVVDDPRADGKVYRVVSLGTPYLGAPKFLSMLLYGEPCEFPIDQVLANGCLIDPRVVQSYIESFPGAAELSPSAAYFAAASTSPLETNVGGGEQSLPYAQAMTAIADRLAVLASPAVPTSRSLIDAAQNYHRSVDNWSPYDPSVGLLRMVGYDAIDATNPEVLTGCGSVPSGYSPQGTIVSTDVGTAGMTCGSGDGTVPLYSASVYNPATGFDDRGVGHNMYWCGVSHMGLAQSNSVWSAAEVYLEGLSNDTLDSVGEACPGGTIGSLAQLHMLGTATAVVAGSPNPAQFGQPVTIAATVVGAVAGTSVPTGTVTFFDGSSILGVAALIGHSALAVTLCAPTGNPVVVNHGRCAQRPTGAEPAAQHLRPLRWRRRPRT